MIPEEAIYVGKIMHMRFVPRQHKFQYSFFSLFIDIDSIHKTEKKIKLLSVNKFNLVSFYERDHGARDNAPLRSWVDNQLKKNKMLRANKVFLLSFPRVFGYVFNPFSAYFCYSNGVLSSIIYEVKNTFGEQISYVKKVTIDNRNLIQHSQRKEMYVSPFIEMAQTYSFSLQPPGTMLSIRISQSGRAGKTLVATQNGRAIELSNINLFKCLLAYPLMTFKVTIGIHWQALILLLKGLKFYKYKTEDKNKTV